MKIKTEKVLDAYSVLNNAKYTKMSDEDAVKVWKIGRILSPVATKFDDDKKDAYEKMKPEGFDDDLQNAQEYEHAMKDKSFDASKLKMGASEYGAFIAKIQKYNKQVSDAVKEFAEKTVKLEFEPISEDAFGKLMASNEWTIEQVVGLGEIIVNE